LPLLESLTIHAFNRLSDLWYYFGRSITPNPSSKQSLMLGIGSQPYHTKRKIPVVIMPKHRAKHIYAIGGTGVGKTKFLENLIRQDILMGNGFGLIDCHGDLIKSTVKFIASLIPDLSSVNDAEQALLKRLVILDPSYGNYTAGFNPLELTQGLEPYGQALELLGVFDKLWDFSSGPRMSEMLRNTMATLAENGLTLLEVQPLLTNDAFREHAIQNLTNNEVRRYWLERFNPLSAAMKAQYNEPVLNKVGAFVTDPNIRAIIGQQKSTIKLRDIMDSGKVLLVNLAKGYLKENSMLLGALLLAKIQMSAMSRADMPEDSRRPWYLYVDEFQNFATDSFTEILSEARKFGLSLVMANQNLSQLPTTLRSSIKANVGTQVVFRVSQDDAMEFANEILPKQKERIASTITNQEIAHALVNIKGQGPVEIRVPNVREPKSDRNIVDLIYQRSIKKYGRLKSDVEVDINNRRQVTGDTKQRNDHEDNGDDASKSKPVKPTKAPFAPKGKFNEGK